MKQLNVEAKSLKNIQDKDQKYIIISDDKDKVIINVGTKTYEAVAKLNALNPLPIKTAKP